MVTNREKGQTNEAQNLPIEIVQWHFSPGPPARRTLGGGIGLELWSKYVQRLLYFRCTEA